MSLGKLSYVELRKQWSSEPKFSDWLAQEDNLAELSNAVNIDLSLVKREEEVGKFRLDILAKEDGSERMVAIENQFGKTDHDHLGKLMTYAAGCDAKTVIWIVEEVCEEHQAAIKWLNDNISNEVEFFLVQIKLLKINNSDPAPLFTVIERPNDWVRDARTEAGEMTARQNTRLEFWTEFSAYAKDDKQFSKTFRPRKPSTDHWLNFACGFSSFHLALTIKNDDLVGVEIYIPNDKDQYEKFEKSKAAIEGKLGFHPDWQPLPGKKAARIYYSTKLNWLNPDTRKDCFVWLAQHAVTMKNAFVEYAD